MQGIDEFNYYFMTLVIWVGSAATARNFVEGHIKVDLIGPYIKNKKIVDGLQFFWQILSVITIVIFTKLSYEYTLFNKEMRFTMSGMRFPMWIFFAFLSVVSSVITLYEVWNLVFLFRRLFLKRPAVGWEAGLPPGIAEGAQDDGSDRKGGV
jgi:TRAP-type C4-dicarboxylate transport system permease small subunit